MKTIKFRGKCKDTDEIVTGNLLVLPDACYIVRPTFFTARDDDPKHFSIFWDQTTKYPSQTAIMVYPVCPDSVAQFVGYDKDGNEIYSNDGIYLCKLGVYCHAKDFFKISDIGKTFDNVVLVEREKK